MSVDATGAGQVESQPRSEKLKVTTILRDYGIVFGGILLAIALTISSHQFLTGSNLSNLLDQWSPAAIMAAALTLVLICGGFDLSAGSVYALAGVVAAKVAPHGVGVAMLAGILSGTVVGVVNGGLVTIGRINAFIATLSTGFIVGGLSLALSNGLLVSIENQSFLKLGQDTFLGLTWGVYLMVVVLVLAGLLLHRTILGRRIYAVGGNPEAAKLSGVPVEGVRFFTFALMGTVAGLAGVLQASRVAFGEAEAGGLTLLFEVFAIVIVGGTSLSGGEGAMWRTAVGVAILAMIGNAFVLLNLSAVYQQVFFGAIILAAVAIDAWGRVNTTR
jgi:ribose transport system permease protein